MCKEIRLKRLVLSNWKTLNLDVTFNDGKTIVKGRNGVGKSSLASAWNWLLSGYTNAVSPKNHELFDNRVELTHETPTASVKAWISVNGIEYTIERTARAKFTRKRGKDEWVKDSSDTYKTFIDEIEISATDFSNWVDVTICPSDMAIYCLDGSFFAYLADDDRRKARKVLETIVGEITARDYTADYSLLLNDFAKGYTVEQIEERVRNQARPLRDRQSKIPTLIADKERMIAEYSEERFDELEREIAEKRQAITELDDVIMGIETPNVKLRNELHAQLNDKYDELDKAKREFISEWQNRKYEIQRKIDDVKHENICIRLRNEQKEQAFDRLQARLKKAQDELASAKEYREVLLKRKNDIKGKSFQGEECPYCGQPLPLDMLETAKDKFNKQKTEDLEYIITQGKQTKAKIDCLMGEVKEMQSEVAKGYIMEMAMDTTELDAEMEKHIKSYAEFERTNIGKKMTKEIQDLTKKLSELKESNTAELINTKKTLLNALETLNMRYGVKYKADELKAEIDSLKCELRELGNAVAKLEMIEDKCKEYVEERARIISQRINGKLKNTAIQMWQTQKNGELTPSCTITDKQGVKYSTLNNSNRIKTCIELQQMFCKHYGIEMPIFIDEYSVFDSINAPIIDTQHICLIASDSPTLVVE